MSCEGKLQFITEPSSPDPVSMDGVATADDHVTLFAKDQCVKVYPSGILPGSVGGGGAHSEGA